MCEAKLTRCQPINKQLPHVYNNLKRASRASLRKLSVRHLGANSELRWIIDSVCGAVTLCPETIERCVVHDLGFKIHMLSTTCSATIFKIDRFALQIFSGMSNEIVIVNILVVELNLIGTIILC